MCVDVWYLILTHVITYNHFYLIKLLLVFTSPYLCHCFVDFKCLNCSSFMLIFYCLLCGYLSRLIADDCLHAFCLAQSNNFSGSIWLNLGAYLMGNSEDGKSIKTERPSSPVATVSIVYVHVKHFIMHAAKYYYYFLVDNRIRPIKPTHRTCMSILIGLPCRLPTFCFHLLYTWNFRFCYPFSYLHFSVIALKL